MKSFVTPTSHKQSLKARFCMVGSLLGPCKIPQEDKQAYPSPGFMSV